MARYWHVFHMDLEITQLYVEIRSFVLFVMKSYKVTWGVQYVMRIDVVLG